MTIQGIFTAWNGLNFVEKPDSIFKRKLEHNPIFPFEETDLNVYVMTARSARCIVGLLLFFGVIGGTALLYYNIGHVDEMIIFPVTVAILFLVHSLMNIKSRTYVLDNNLKMYEFYRGRKLIYRGHYHNIYIRLKGENAGGGDVYHSIVLGGFHIDEYAITGSMITAKRLTKWGRRLAHRLDLNFFEAADKSRDHVIRHRCPYADM